VIAVNVGDQNEVGLGKPGELRRLGRVEINSFTSRLDQGAGMVQWRDFDRPGRGGKDLCPRRAPANGTSINKA